MEKVEIVRCKDCIKRGMQLIIPVNNGDIESYTISPCPCEAFNLDDDFFCAKGERKDETD